MKYCQFGLVPTSFDTQVSDKGTEIDFLLKYIDSISIVAGVGTDTHIHMLVCTTFVSPVSPTYILKISN